MLSQVQSLLHFHGFGDLEHREIEYYPQRCTKECWIATAAPAQRATPGSERLPDSVWILCQVKEQSVPAQLRGMDPGWRHAYMRGPGKSREAFHLVGGKALRVLPQHEKPRACPVLPQPGLDNPPVGLPHLRSFWESRFSELIYWLETEGWGGGPDHAKRWKVWQSLCFRISEPRTS